MSEEAVFHVSSEHIRELLVEAKHASDKAYSLEDRHGYIWYSGIAYALKSILESNSK